MKLLTQNFMASVEGGLSQQFCNDTAVARWILTGVFTGVSCIPVVGWIIGGPSAVSLYVIDGVCAFMAQNGE